MDILLKTSRRDASVWLRLLILEPLLNCSLNLGEKVGHLLHSFLVLANLARGLRCLRMNAIWELLPMT
jgi:hypothetical protein